MRHLPLAAFAIAVLTIPFLARASRAAQPVSETVLVCVGGGGESLVVEEWTAERIAAARERGRTPPRVHPETGTCDDPAGLSVALENAGDAAAFLCSKDANGEWRGPDWIVSIYVLGDEVPPAPTTGDCPAPLAYPRPQPPETERAAALVVYFSQLEAASDFSLLYRWMHPDARAMVPREAVVGWYEAEFAPRGPAPIEVDRVRFIDWTWGVTGRTYPRTAEVAYRQRFADGSEESGRVRLVQDAGVWRWFFGRDRTFVEEQSRRFGDSAPTGDGHWLDGDRSSWNASGMAIPDAPPGGVPPPDACVPFVWPAETAEDAQVVAHGWRLASSDEGGWGIVLVGGFVNFDVMCRPVTFQRFAVVDGVFAGTLAPWAMLPRTDGALTDAGIATEDRIFATYDRYAPTDPICCPSATTVVSFAVERTGAKLVVVPEPDASAAAPRRAAPGPGRPNADMG